MSQLTVSNVLVTLWTTIVLSGACSYDRHPDAPPSSTPTPAATTIPEVASPQTPVVSAPTEPPSACPSDMKEVTGKYCASVTHLCIDGRHQDGTPVHCPKGCAVPYFCDAFVEGYAVCGMKMVTGPGGKKQRVIDETPKHFCIDQYEYPNRVGETPSVMVTWRQAKGLCEAQGKRLCGDDEWTLACEGPNRQPYAYGWVRDATTCNIDNAQRTPGPSGFALGSSNSAVREAEVARLDQRVLIGSSPRCASPYGVYDMVGNVDEWTVNVTLGGKPYKSLFKGGHWVRGARNRCRPSTDGHNEDFAFYAEGFRCCANPR